MADKHTPAQRRFNMQQIKSKNTKPEIKVRQGLFSKGYRYRINDKKLPGKPDIVLKKYKTVVLVNGCFWHGHENCKYFVLPKTREEFWFQKIQKNIFRDLKNYKQLTDLGWKVITVWECELKTKVIFDNTIEKIAEQLENTKLE